MKLKEFADKYDVPYIVPYNATYKVKYYISQDLDREYDEEELRAETIRQAEEKVRIYKERLARQTEILGKLNGSF